MIEIRCGEIGRTRQKQRNEKYKLVRSICCYTSFDASSQTDRHLCRVNWRYLTFKSQNCRKTLKNWTFRKFSGRPGIFFQKVTRNRRLHFV